MLHDAMWRDDWAIWLAAEKLGAINTALGPVYSLYSLAVEEAIHGAGVLIGHAPLVAPALASGALVAPFARRVAAKRPLIAVLREPVVAQSPLAELVRRLAGPVNEPEAPVST